jgi:hypothetical protein
VPYEILWKRLQLGFSRTSSRFVPITIPDDGEDKRDCKQEEVRDGVRKYLGKRVDDRMGSRQDDSYRNKG